MGLLLLVGVGGMAIKNRYFPSALVLPLPDKPSIVVLPFTNLSGDPEQEYFNDGITEDLTSDLSRLSGLFVIARNSAFTYKGKAVKVQEVSRELGVHYVLEGSVRKGGDRLRITAQLIDATTGYQVWSEQYDRPLQGLFALQDEIAQKIVTTLKLQLTLAEQGIFTRKGTGNLAAYDAYLRGLENYLRRTQEANAQARQMCEKAVELDPQYAEAYTLLGRTYLREYFWGWNRTPQTLEQAFVLARKAISLDASLPMAHRLLAYVYLWQKQYDRAITEAEQALALDANDAEGYETLGEILSFAGRPQDTLGLAEKGLRLNPRQPVSLLWLMGRAYLLTRQYEEAIAVLKKTLLRNPNYFAAHLDLAVIYSELGREEEARAEVAEVLRVSPGLSLEMMRNRPTKDPAVTERYVEGLRRAGLK
jgi:TolB-like protein/Flp pilus assembly protein TadD